MPQYSAVPDHNVFQNLLVECEDSPFWQNFKRAAPIIFCKLIEEDQDLKQVRDMSFIEEILKTKTILKLINQKLESGDADIDIVEYALATKMLEQKLAVLQALNIETSDETEQVTLNIRGSNKSILVDLKKLREAITVQDTQVEEKEGTMEEKKKDIMENIDLAKLSEEEFLNVAIERIGEVEKTKNKTIARDSFVKIFRFTGEFAKFKCKELKKTGQEKRLTQFEADPKKYLQILKEVMEEEEKCYEKSTQVIFDKLCITPECFERTQAELMQDPYASMEIFYTGINMEQPNIDPPEALTRDTTIDLVKKSNDYAFDLFKKEYMNSMNDEPFLMPVVVSAIAHDWVLKRHGYNEDQFKSALFKFKIYEDPSVSSHMQQKQFELLSATGMGGMNPMMMGGMGGPGMGGPPMGGPGMGGPGMFGPPL